MPRMTAFPGIETAYPDLDDIPGASEIYIAADGADYNITLAQITTRVSEGIDAYTSGAEVAAALDSYLGSAVWRAGAGEFTSTLLDEDDFISDSASAAPTQQSTKAYIASQLSASTVTALRISDSTAAGRSMITAANAAAQRTLLNVEDGATADQSGAEIVALLEALTTTARLDYTGVDGLDGAGAGALFSTALIAAAGLSAGDVVRVTSGGTAFEGLDVEVTTPTPATASSSSGSVTLDFLTSDTVTTTTTEAITTVAVSNLSLYETGLWRVTQTTARDITFPVGWRMPNTWVSRVYPGVANTVVLFRIWRSGASTYDVTASQELTVGA